MVLERPQRKLCQASPTGLETQCFPVVDQVGDEDEGGPDQHSLMLGGARVVVYELYRDDYHDGDRGGRLEQVGVQDKVRSGLGVNLEYKQVQQSLA